MFNGSMSMLYNKYQSVASKQTTTFRIQMLMSKNVLLTKRLSCVLRHWHWCFRTVNRVDQSHIDQWQSIEYTKYKEHICIVAFQMNSTMQTKTTREKWSKTRSVRSEWIFRISNLIIQSKIAAILRSAYLWIEEQVYTKPLSVHRLYRWPFRE